MINELLSLTKEQFWDELQEKYPDQMKVFSDWIDQYKKRVNWINLFNDDPYNSSYVPKYHDLPIAMQVGIFIEFCMEHDHRYQLIEGLPLNMQCMAEIIKTFFEQEHILSQPQPEPVSNPTPDEIVNKVLNSGFSGAIDPENL